MNNPVSQEYTNTLEAIRQALGGELPEPGTPAFEQALRRIQRERPELLDALKALRDPSALPPVNPAHAATLKDFRAALRRARGVERVQAWLNRVFGVKDPRRDKVHFNFRLVALLLGGAVFAAGTLWALWPELSRALAGLHRPPPVAAEAPRAQPGPESPLRPLPGSTPGGADPGGAGVGGSPQGTGAGPLVPPPAALPPAPDPAALPTPPTPAAGYPTPSPATATPNAGVVPPPPLPDYGASPQPVGPGGGGGSAAAPAAPARREPLALRAEAPQPGRGHLALGGEGAGGQPEPRYVSLKDPPAERYLALEGGPREAVGALALPPSAAAGGDYVALATQGEALPARVALAPERPAAEGAEPAGAPLPAGDRLPSPAAADPGPSPSAGAPAPGWVEGGAGPGSPLPSGASAATPTPTPPTPAPTPAPTPTPTPAALDYPFEIGEKQQGELVSGVVIPEGSSQAALMVRTKEGYVFFGAATLDKAGRLQMQFDRAYKGKMAYVVRAVALDERGVAGVPAQVSEQAPNLVTNLLRGAASGLVSYIEFYAKSSSTTILPGGGVASSSAPPPLGLTILSGSARQIAAPPDSTSVVRVWSLEPGTKMQILIVPGDVGGR